jgi:hypothetical protein
MGLPTWAKCKLEENWPASLSEAIMKVEGFSYVGRGEKSGFKKDNKFLHKKSRHEREWNQRQDNPKKKKPKQFQGSRFKPKGNFVKKGLLSKRANPREMSMGNPKEHASIITKWGIIPKIAPSPKQGAGVLK